MDDQQTLNIKWFKGSSDGGTIFEFAKKNNINIFYSNDFVNNEYERAANGRINLYNNFLQDFQSMFYFAEEGSKAELKNIKSFPEHSNKSEVAIILHYRHSGVLFYDAEKKQKYYLDNGSIYSVSKNWMLQKQNQGFIYIPTPFNAFNSKYLNVLNPKLQLNKSVNNGLNQNAIERILCGNPKGFFEKKIYNNCKNYQKKINDCSSYCIPTTLSIASYIISSNYKPDLQKIPSPLFDKEKLIIDGVKKDILPRKTSIYNVNELPPKEKLKEKPLNCTSKIKRC